MKNYSSFKLEKNKKMKDILEITSNNHGIS